MINYSGVYSQMLSKRVLSVWKEPERYYNSENTGFCVTFKIAVGDLITKAAIESDKARKELSSIVIRATDCGGATQEKMLWPDRVKELVKAADENDGLILLGRQTIGKLMAHTFRIKAPEQRTS